VKYSPLFWPVRFKDDVIYILDETLLPEKLHYIKVKDVRQACKAIKEMKTRAVGQVTYESTYLNAGYDYIDAHDQTSITKPNVEANGWSFWFTPRSKIGWEALIRYDHMKPDSRFDNQIRTRTIIGAAYWFPHQGTVSTTLMLDYDGQVFDNFAPALPSQKKLAVHALVNF